MQIILNIIALARTLQTGLMSKSAVTTSPPIYRG